MTSAEGEAGRHSQWWGVSGAGIRGQLEGSLQHSRPCPALTAVRPHFLEVVCFSVFWTHTTTSHFGCDICWTNLG